MPDDEIKVRLLFNSVLPHPGFIFRKEICTEKGYDESFRYAKDYEFQARASMKYPISCMEYIGVKYRRTANQISTKKYEEQQECANRVRKRMFQYFSVVLNEKECKNIQLLSSNRLYEMTWKQLLSAIKILFRLKYNVKKELIYRGKIIVDNAFGRGK